MSEREMWACVSNIPGMYWKKIQRQIEVFGDIDNWMAADKKMLMHKGGLDEGEAERIIKHRECFSPESFFKKLEKKEIKFVSVSEKEYPKRLLPYNHKPYYLFYKGNLPDEEAPCVAMVGARACSNYGRTVARGIAKELSEKGIQIISGMARGVDTYSQLGACEGKAETFAVLGCGVDICYPSENIELYEEILKKGGIISEYLPGTAPISWHFPQRNRLICGLADKIVVVEAKENSGSLITVEWALEQGKDVMAVPGRIGERLSQGCNQLIKSGAGIVTSTNDVLSELTYNMSNKQETEKILEKDFLLLYSELGFQPKNINELMDDTGIKYEEIISMLLKLQLDGFIEQPVENYFSRKYI